MQSISISDPDIHFTVFKVPRWRAKIYQFLSVRIWGNLPSNLQRRLSAWYSRFYTKSYSKKIIGPYLKINYSDKDYLQKFKPPYGKKEFDTFQDFFIREFREHPQNNSDHVWPCEGLLCDTWFVEDLSVSSVKGDKRSLTAIFQADKNPIPNDYFFSLLRISPLLNSGKRRKSSQLLSFPSKVNSS